MRVKLVVTSLHRVEQLSPAEGLRIVAISHMLDSPPNALVLAGRRRTATGAEIPVFCAWYQK
jgi:hypothetical protein